MMPSQVLSAFTVVYKANVRGKKVGLEFSGNDSHGKETSHADPLYNLCFPQTLGQIEGKLADCVVAACSYTLPCRLMININSGAS